MITEGMIQRYTDLINRNCKGEALEGIARDLKKGYFTNLFASINRIVDLEGSIRQDVLAVRERYRLEFNQYLKQELNESDYVKIAKFV